MNKRKTEIQKAILEIENPFPNDNIIICYKDFLKFRDFLPYYRYNQKVFSSIVLLTISVWDSKEERINRRSLIELIKKYGLKNHKKETLSAKTSANLFQLFKKIMDPINASLLKSSSEIIKLNINNSLRNVRLNEEDLNWLIKNVDKSHLILTRLLRYPLKNKQISQWVKTNFHQDIFRHRRAELISWLIDEDIEFKIDKQTLIDDFEYLNAIDIQSIWDFLDALKVKDFIKPGSLENKLPERLTLINTDSFDNAKEINDTLPKLKLSGRSYGMWIYYSRESLYISNNDYLRDHFYKNLEDSLNATMLWGVAYSRLKNAQKGKLLKKYYTDDIYWVFLKISKRLQSINLLEWVKSCS